MSKTLTDELRENLLCVLMMMSKVDMSEELSQT